MKSLRNRLKLKDLKEEELVIYRLILTYSCLHNYYEYYKEANEHKMKQAFIRGCKEVIRHRLRLNPISKEEIYRKLLDYYVNPPKRMFVRAFITIKGKELAKEYWKLMLRLDRGEDKVMLEQAKKDSEKIVECSYCKRKIHNENYYQGKVFGKIYCDDCTESLFTWSHIYDTYFDRENQEVLERKNNE